MESANIALMFRSALPIYDIDKVVMQPGEETIIVVWVDTQDRPDLSNLAALHGQSQGELRLQWFADAQEKIIGLRIEMHAATNVVFHLAFQTKRYPQQLGILAEHGLLWVIPSEPSPQLEVMNARDILAIPGIQQGVTLELDLYMRSVLRETLHMWKGVK
jgi:hypothetical protein